MIQDIIGTYHNEYRNELPEKTDYVMFVKGRSVLTKVCKQEIDFLTFQEIDTFLDVQKVSFTYLFSIDMDGVNRKFFLCDEKNVPDNMLPEYTWENQKLFRTAMPKDLAFAGITSCQLGAWYENTKYCGSCGGKLVHDTKERMMKCPACNLMHYPKLSPAVIIAITDGDRIVMTKYAGREYKNYALVAGYTELGETLEETVKREVLEEVGLHVKNIQYYKSQPWSFTDTLLVGFFCELDGSDQIKMDEEELAVAEWVKRDDIEVTFDDISLTNEMIVKFKNM